VVELLSVLIRIGIILTIAIPRINLRAARIEAATRSVNMIDPR